MEQRWLSGSDQRDRKTHVIMSVALASPSFLIVSEVPEFLLKLSDSSLGRSLLKGRQLDPVGSPLPPHGHSSCELESV